MAPSNSVQSVHMVFTGRVQGVGFRFTAQRFAHDLRLCGWVKNLPDGSVELLVQGQKAGIDEFLARLQTHFAMADVHIGQGMDTFLYNSFEIRY